MSVRLLIQVADAQHRRPGLRHFLLIAAVKHLFRADVPVHQRCKCAAEHLRPVTVYVIRVLEQMNVLRKILRPAQVEIIIIHITVPDQLTDTGNIGVIITHTCEQKIRHGSADQGQRYLFFLTVIHDAVQILHPVGRYLIDMDRFPSSRRKKGILLYGSPVGDISFSRIPFLITRDVIICIVLICACPLFLQELHDIGRIKEIFPVPARHDKTVGIVFRTRCAEQEKQLPDRSLQIVRNNIRLRHLGPVLSRIKCAVKIQLQVHVLQPVVFCGLPDHHHGSVHALRGSPGIESIEPQFPVEKLRNKAPVAMRGSREQDVNIILFIQLVKGNPRIGTGVIRHQVAHDLPAQDKNRAK